MALMLADVKLSVSLCLPTEVNTSGNSVRIIYHLFPYIVVQMYSVHCFGFIIQHIVFEIKQMTVVKVLIVNFNL